MKGVSRRRRQSHRPLARQQIWQRTGLFDEGNTFIKDKLELTTGSIICIVDKTVWGLYEGQMRKWASSVDLELRPIIAPGNRDEKSMENMLFLLDELKRVDPLRRAEPALAIGGGVLRTRLVLLVHCGDGACPGRLPTTLLGMVDASVGIKVAVNYHPKNGVGPLLFPDPHLRRRGVLAYFGASRRYFRLWRGHEGRLSSRRVVV